MADAEAPPAEELPRKRGKHLMERLLWNGSFLRCPGKNCQGIVERHVEPRHGEVRADVHIVLAAPLLADIMGGAA